MTAPVITRSPGSERGEHTHEPGASDNAGSDLRLHDQAISDHTDSTMLAESHNLEAAT